MVAIPEFLRLLCEDGVSFTKALNLARRVFAYTNHTVMQEALEVWDAELVRSVCPAAFAVIELIQAEL